MSDYLGDGAVADDDGESLPETGESVSAGTHVNAIANDGGWDVTYWKRAQEWPEVAEAIRDFGLFRNNSNLIHEDIYNLLRKGEPVLRREDEMVEGHQVQATVAQAMHAMPEMDTLRVYTSDLVAAGMVLVDLEPAIKELYDAATAAQEDGQELTEREVQVMMREAVKEAADNQQKNDLLARGMGLEPSDMQRMSFSERQALARKLSKNRLSKFVDMLGAFKAVSTGRRVKNFHTGTYQGVEFGDDLTRLHSNEVLRMAVPELGVMVEMAYAEGTLMLNRRQEETELGKGPVVVVCDESSSMAGEPEASSKALALALLSHAHTSPLRPFAYVGFDTTTRVVEIPERSFTKAVDMVEGFLNGGTAFGPALKAMMESVDNLSAGTSGRADAVFITDGMSTVPPKVLEEVHEWMNRTGSQIYGIYIGPKSANITTLQSFCTNVRSLDSLTPGAVADIFTSL